MNMMYTSICLNVFLMFFNKVLRFPLHTFLFFIFFYLFFYLFFIFPLHTLLFLRIYSRFLMFSIANVSGIFCQNDVCPLLVVTGINLITVYCIYFQLPSLKSVNNL